MITQSYKIDMTPGAVPLRVKVSQYDVGIRQLLFQLFNGATACTSNSFDLSAQIVGTKQDQKGFAYEASVDTSALGIWVTVDITEQMTACAGDVVCEIRMYNNSSRISTANFILEVEPAALGSETDISETELPDIIDEGRRYAEAAEEAAERAEEAAAGMSAGAAIGNSTSVTSGVVDTNIDLGKTPSDGDRILMYVETEIESPVSLKTYNDGVAITTSFGSSGPESLAGLCLLEYTEDTTDYWALLWMDEGGGGGIGDAYAGLGVGKMVSFTDDVVNTDIDLHRAPIEGDRILFYHSSALANPSSLTVYNNGTAVTANIFDFISTHPAGLTLMKYGALGWQTVQDIADGGYTAGTGISISGSTISNSAPQNGDNVAYAAVSSVTSGDLGYFNGLADYFMIDFRTDAEPYNGKYTLKLSLGATIKHAVLKDRDGNLYADDFMSGNLVQCVKTSSGSGSEQDPVVVTVLAVENNDAAYVTATGNPIALTDALAGNAIEVSAEIVASQDLHGYDKPWVGGAGKNKAGGTITGAYVGSSGTIGADASFDLHYGKVTSGVTYTITTDDPNFVGGFFENEPAIGSTTYDGQRVVTNNKTFTAPITGYVAFRSNSGYTTAQLEVGETATSYEPYTNVCPITGFSSVVITNVDSESHTATVTVALGSTVYGGTLDLTSGELTITHGFITLDGTQEIIIANWKPKANSIGWLYRYSLTNAKVLNADEVGDIISDTLTADTYQHLFNNDVTGITFYTDTSYGLVVRVADTSLTTSALINAYLASNPIQICYELATPTTTTLTAAQLALVKGQNTLTCNSGDMSITYKASGLDALKERVDDLEDAVADIETDMASKVENSVVGTVESGTTASQAYAVGEHFIRNDAFCTAIAAIASGATLTLNTNYVEGTIAEAVANKYNYSTTEHVVGKWIDGSDIYEITVDIGDGGYGRGQVIPTYKNGFYTTSIPTANIKLITQAWGMTKQGNFFGVNATREDTYVKLCIQADDAYYVKYLTLQYTKNS